MAQAQATPVAKPVAFNRYFALIYLTMAVGLAITAAVSQGVYSNPDLMRRILFNPWFAFGLFLLQIFLVVGISAAVMRLSPGVAFLLFLLYSALTGIAISSIFIYYSQSTIFYTFWMAAGMFLFCSVVGLFIKRDLSGLGLFLLLALMGWTFGLFLTWFFPFAQGLNLLLMGVALVVAVARGISVIMTNGLIIDTVLFWCQQALAGLTSVAFINTIFLLYIPLSFLIPSSSGLATVTMPVMAPLANFAGVPTHLIVTAYQSASGLVNLVTPTFAVVTGGLAIGRISFAVWWRWVAGLVLILALMIMVVLSIGALVG